LIKNRDMTKHWYLHWLGEHPDRIHLQSRDTEGGTLINHLCDIADLIRSIKDPEVDTIEDDETL